jgi:hypothetical protein
MHTFRTHTPLCCSEFLIQEFFVRHISTSPVCDSVTRLGIIFLYYITTSDYSTLLTWAMISQSCHQRPDPEAALLRVATGTRKGGQKGAQRGWEG